VAKSKVFGDREQSGAVSINMTPMIDCVFQLILFFLIGSQLASKEISPLSVASPYKARSTPEAKFKEWRTIVNVLCKEDPDYGKGETDVDGQLARFEILGERINDDPEADQKLMDIIKKQREAAQNAGRKEFYVEIRADYRVAFEHVYRALVAAAQAGIEKINVTVSRRGSSKL